MDVLRKQHGYAYHAEQAPNLGGGVLCNARARMLVRLAAFADVRTADVSHIDAPDMRQAVTDVFRAYSPVIRFAAEDAGIVVTDSAKPYNAPPPGKKTFCWCPWVLMIRPSVRPWIGHSPKSG